MGTEQTNCFPNLAGCRALSSWNYDSLEVTLGNSAFGSREPLRVVEQLICEGLDRMEVSNKTKVWPRSPNSATSYSSLPTDAPPAQEKPQASHVSLLFR